jgi:non-specific serine/threonine protein kinase
MVYLLTAEAVNLEYQLRNAQTREGKAGREFAAQGRAKIDYVEPHQALLTVNDLNGRAYPVRVTISQNGAVVASCNCDYRNYYMHCRHRVAALISLHEHLKAHPPSLWRAVLGEALRAPAKSSAPQQKVILFSLQQYADAWTLAPYTLPTKLFSPEQFDDPQLLAQTVAEQNLGPQASQLKSVGNPFAYRHATADDLAAARLAIAPASGGYYTYSGYGHSLYIAPPSEALLAFMPLCLVFLGDGSNPLKRLLEVPEQAARLELAVDEAGDSLRVEPWAVLGTERLRLHGRKTRLVLRRPLWLLLDGRRLVHFDESGSAAALFVENPEVEIPAAERDEFLDRYLAPLADAVPVGGSAIAWAEINTAPTPRLYLSEQNGQLQAALRFAYEAFELPYDKNLPEQSTRRQPGTTLLARVRRKPDEEQAAFERLTPLGLKRGAEPGLFLLRANVDPLDFLLHKIPRVIEAGFELFGEKDLQVARVNRHEPTISFNVSSGIDWFDVGAAINYGEIMVSLKEMRRAIKNKERYIKLADGSIGAIPEEWVEQYRHLFALGEDHGDTVRLSQAHITLIDQLLGEADRAQADAEFERRRQKLRSFESIAARPLPQGFIGELRPYQKAGYDWLHFLHEYGFGGCLADDMGVGKTIQTLAFLQSLRENHAQAADLIVLPRSLIFNWQREAEKFTPGMNILVYADQQRVRDVAAFEGCDLVLTTYGVMRRDLEQLRSYRFHYLVLDESQAIKNPLAETSKAARLLNGEHRLCLTGTPVENSTLELWSQFAFLNPGLLGSADYFRESFVNPIERKQSTETAEFLRKLVYPFILRRTKAMVAPELPPRTERVLVSEMEPAQRKLYNRQRDYYRALLLKLIQEDGMSDARMKILEGLLRLRQICCHPRLADPEFKGGSAKLEQLLETLDNVRAEGHKALIFSQFVQMLSIVRAELDARAMPYAYLDGSTRDRQAEVDRFQNDEALPCFLISLKAGGVGLNLTAADYVIHIDPWWNPAVEQQASDRTHRIGQDKPVFVYKLVARDSVEEKILQLQDHKRALVDQLISPEGGVFKALTRDDVEALFT